MNYEDLKRKYPELNWKEAEEIDEEDLQAAADLLDRMTIEEPSFDPECSESTEDDEVECEFENRDGSWWCTTHNCHA